MDRTASKSINKRIWKNGDIPGDKYGDIPGDKYGDIPGDTTSWGYPYLSPAYPRQGISPGISPEGIFANTSKLYKITIIFQKKYENILKKNIKLNDQNFKQKEFNLKSIKNLITEKKFSIL